MSKKRQRIFTLNEPNAPRLNPALAEEIGLNESILLLQIEFWISISDNKQDGKYWTYQSIRDIKDKMFTFWSISTINRALNKLIKEGYLIEGNYNKRRYDKTRWFALNFERLSELSSISVPTHGTGVFHNEPGSNHNEPGSNHNEPRSIQNETTIPESTTESTTKITTESTSAKLKESFENLWKLYPNKKGKQPAFKKYKKVIKEGTKDEEIKQGIINYKKEIEIKGVDDQFVRYGSTWFNQEGWLDDYETHDKKIESHGKEWDFFTS